MITKEMLEKKFRDLARFENSKNGTSKIDFGKGAQAAIPLILQLAEALEFLSKTDTSENPPDLLWLNKWRNDAKSLAQNYLAALEKFAGGDE